MNELLQDLELGGMDPVGKGAVAVLKDTLREGEAGKGVDDLLKPFLSGSPTVTPGLHTFGPVALTIYGNMI